MFYRLRPYHQAAGRMLNRNPWGYIHKTPSLYDYADNLPTRYTEPFSAVIDPVTGEMVNDPYHDLLMQDVRNGAYGSSLTAADLADAIDQSVFLPLRDMNDSSLRNGIINLKPGSIHSRTDFIINHAVISTFLTIVHSPVDMLRTGSGSGRAIQKYERGLEDNEWRDIIRDDLLPDFLGASGIFTTGASIGLSGAAKLAATRTTSVNNCVKFSYNTTRNTGTGYRVIDARYAESTLKSGRFFKSGAAGRLGNDGVYINNTIEGAIAEFKFHNPQTPFSIIETQYPLGNLLEITHTPNNLFNSRLPFTGDANILVAPSLRAPHTMNLLIREGAKPIRILPY